VILSVLPLFLPSIFGKKLSKLRQDHLESIEMYNIKIKDFFSGFELIKSFNIDSVIKKNHSKANKEVENRKYGYNSSNAFVDALSNILSVFMQFAVFLITGFLIIMKNLSIGTMSAAMQLCGMTVYPVRSIVESLTRMKSAKYVNKKVLDLINVQEEKGKGLHVDQLKACIEFKNVSFAYNDKNVLNNLNFKLEKGKKYAIVGASGSGKSTLAKLLLGYYENYNGDILLDNHDIRKINVESISKIFSIIHQNVFIFEDSLKNNITLYNNYDEAKIEKSIHAAGLNKFIETLNDGMKTHIDENGKKLSGGEKQRIAIARAIVTGSNVLILDEATANLDNEIAYNIENSLLKTKDLTSIVITHRLNKELLAYYDQILVFKNGEICEHGSFNELINKKEYFYSLYKIAN
jgi:ATP-binding cassette subfamily C protein